ncbi:MAG: hypothetical protein AB7G35_09610, partial [Hyphomicrobiaceae bacterium]
RNIIGRDLRGELQIQNHTRNISLLVSLSIPKFVRSLLQEVTNFGIGTLAERQPLPPVGRT